MSIKLRLNRTVFLALAYETSIIADFLYGLQKPDWGISHWTTKHAVPAIRLAKSINRSLDDLSTYALAFSAD